MNEALAKALTHPLRVRVFACLRERPQGAKLLSEELGHPLSNVAYHVRRLHDLGLIRLVKKVPHRGAVERIYAAVPVADLCAPRAGAAAVRERSLLHFVPAVLDAEGWKDVAAIMDRALSEIATAGVQSAKRLAGTDERGSGRRSSSPTVICPIRSAASPRRKRASAARRRPGSCLPPGRCEDGVRAAP